MVEFLNLMEIFGSHFILVSVPTGQGGCRGGGSLATYTLSLWAEASAGKDFVLKDCHEKGMEGITTGRAGGCCNRTFGPIYHVSAGTQSTGKKRPFLSLI